MLLLLIVSVAGAQQANTADTHLVVKQLPVEGVMLKNGWKFQAGNNPAWFQSNTVDNSWKTINLDQPPLQFLKGTEGGSGWLRLRFLVDSTLWQTPMSLRITQYGASEVYLDGQLIGKFGSILPGRIIPFNPHNQLIPLHLEHH